MNKTHSLCTVASLLLALVQLNASAADKLIDENFRFIISPEDLPESIQTKVNALALIKVYPFANKREFLQCTGLHIGNGFVLTAGHCFLGALNCNNAKVSFGIPEKASLQAKCTDVLMIEAAGSAYNSSRNDYAIFKVDQSPDVFFNTEAQSEDAKLTTPLMMLGYPRLDRPRNKEVLALSKGCFFSKLEGSDVFERPRAKASVLHNCATVPGMNGAILFDQENLGLVALQQAGSIEPKNGYKPQTITALNNIALSLTRLSAIQNFSPFHSFAAPVGYFETSAVNAQTKTINGQTEVRIGSHIAEAFPLGLNEAIDLDAGSFKAAEHSDQVLHVAVQTGTKTTVKIIDGAGITHTYTGHTLFEETQEKALPSPIQIRVSNSKEAKAFFASVRIR